MTHTHKKTSSVLVALPGTRSRNPFPTPAARCTLGARPSAEVRQSKNVLSWWEQ